MLIRDVFYSNGRSKLMLWLEAKNNKIYKLLRPV